MARAVRAACRARCGCGYWRTSASGGHATLDAPPPTGTRLRLARWRAAGRRAGGGNRHGGRRSFQLQPLTLGLVAPARFIELAQALELFHVALHAAHR